LTPTSAANITDPYQCGGDIYGKITLINTTLKKVTVKLFNTTTNTFDYSFSPIPDNNGNYKINTQNINPGTYRIDYSLEDNNSKVYAGESYIANIKPLSDCSPAPIIANAKSVSQEPMVNLVRTGGLIINIQSIIAIILTAILGGVIKGLFQKPQDE
jgi:hypothetical protein